MTKLKQTHNFTYNYNMSRIVMLRSAIRWCTNVRGAWARDVGERTVGV